MSNLITTWTLHRESSRPGAFYNLQSTVKSALTGRKSFPGCSATVERLNETATRVTFIPPSSAHAARAIEQAHEFAAAIYNLVADLAEGPDGGDRSADVRATVLLKVNGRDQTAVDVTHEMGAASAIVGAYFCDDLAEALS